MKKMSSAPKEHECKLCGDPVDRPGLCDVCYEGLYEREEE